MIIPEFADASTIELIKEMMNEKMGLSSAVFNNGWDHSDEHSDLNSNNLEFKYSVVMTHTSGVCYEASVSRKYVDLSDLEDLATKHLAMASFTIDVVTFTMSVAMIIGKLIETGAIGRHGKIDNTEELADIISYITGTLSADDLKNDIDSRLSLMMMSDIDSDVVCSILDDAFDLHWSYAGEDIGSTHARFVLLATPHEVVSSDEVVIALSQVALMSVSRMKGIPGYVF